MIDLHMHTTYSDGTDNVIEILKKAELKLDCISITDHDKCNAYEELKNIDVKKYYKGEIIKGIEIKCSYKGSTIEVLGYDYDYNKMKAWVKDFYADKDTLGHAMGKEFRASLAILDEGFAKGIQKQMERNTIA